MSQVTNPIFGTSKHVTNPIFGTSKHVTNHLFHKPEDLELYRSVNGKPYQGMSQAWGQEGVTKFLILFAIVFAIN